MPRKLHRFIALCLALLWGPATLCCDLEAAGWELLCASDACHSDEDTKPSVDGCNLVESGKYQSGVSTVKAPPAVAVICACLLCVRDLVPESAPPVAALRRADVPQIWVVRWQFDHRAAAPAHGPDVLNA